ncbi:MAG TPA: hypothetical protein VMT83_06665 [Burkholderiaceae bacterium]|nr:hypothetical protein [Burkholderiaceae bacterium]
MLIVGIEKPSRRRDHRSVRAPGSSKSTRVSGRNGSAASVGAAVVASSGAVAASAGADAAAATADAAAAAADAASAGVNADADADGALAAPGGVAEVLSSSRASWAGGGVTAQPHARAVTTSANDARVANMGLAHRRRIVAVTGDACAVLMQRALVSPGARGSAGSRHCPVITPLCPLPNSRRSHRLESPQFVAADQLVDKLLHVDRRTRERGN